MTAGKLADPNEHLPPEGSGSGETEKQAHKAEQVETPDNQAPMLVMFRAESLPTWAEYVKVNRAYDDDEDPNAKNVANDLDKLSLTRDGKTAVSRVKFDLDLPSAAEDDTPIGPGIALPEWDYRKSVMLEKHCRVQPMVAHDAVPADLPEALAATAKNCVVNLLLSRRKDAGSKPSRMVQSWMSTPVCAIMPTATPATPRKAAAIWPKLARTRPRLPVAG